MSAMRHGVVQEKNKEPFEANREAAARRNLQPPPALVAESVNVQIISPLSSSQPHQSTENAKFSKFNVNKDSASSSLSTPPDAAMFPPLVLEKQSNQPMIKANSTTIINQDLLGQLHSFYEQDQLTDMEIHIQGKTIRAHRVVLAASSDYFRAMFSLNMTERSNGVVTLHDLDPSAVQTLVDFAYTFELRPPLTVENVQPLLYAASILMFNKVLSCCSEFISANLDPSHALSLLPIAQHFGLGELLKSVRSYIARNFHNTILGGADTLSETEDLEDDVLQMSESDIMEIFMEDGLVVRSEHVLLNVLLKWADYNPQEDGETNPRHDSARRIIKTAIKLAYLPASTLYQLLRSEPLTCNAGPELHNLIIDALICQLNSDERGSSSLIGSSRVAELRAPRRCASGALVCVGGRQASTEPFRSAEVYDFTFDRWLRIPDMNARRRHVGVAVGTRQGKRGLYAVGGHDGSRHLDSVEVLALEPGAKWRSVASLHTLRRGLAVTSVQVNDSQTLLFAIGGLDDQSCFPHVEIYDPEVDAWTLGPQMSQSRGGVAAAAIGTRVFAVGGNDGNYSVDSGEVLDPVSGRWCPIARMRHRRAGAGLSVMNGCLWVAGGFDENVPLNAVEFYDPRLNAWQKGPNMRTSRGGVGLATLGNCLFAVGGHDGAEYLQSVECFDPRLFLESSMANTPVSLSSVGAMSPGSAYNATSGGISTNASVSNEWEYVAQLASGRAGAGVVHVADVIVSTDLPVISSPGGSSHRPVADCV